MFPDRLKEALCGTVIFFINQIAFKVFACLNGFHKCKVKMLFGETYKIIGCGNVAEHFVVSLYPYSIFSAVF